MEKLVDLRMQWRAELAEAIESAQRLAWQLGTLGAGSEEARELYGRLEAAKVELDQLRESGAQRMSLAQAMDLLGSPWTDRAD